MKPNSRSTPIGQLQYLVAASVLMLASACASAPPTPTAELLAAKQAIVVAETNEASQFAPGELGDAQARLVSANAAVEKEDMNEALRLALQSRAAADLATAKSESVKAAKVNADMVRSNAALVEEMNRKTGATL